MQFRYRAEFGQVPESTQDRYFCYHNLMRGALHEADTGLSSWAYNQIRTQSMAPNFETFNLLMRVHGAAKEPREACQVEQLPLLLPILVVLPIGTKLTASN